MVTIRLVILPSKILCLDQSRIALRTGFRDGEIKSCISLSIIFPGLPNTLDYSLFLWEAIGVP
jgi:hypothetical protein